MHVITCIWHWVFFPPDPVGTGLWPLFGSWRTPWILQSKLPSLHVCVCGSKTDQVLLTVCLSTHRAMIWRFLSSPLIKSLSLLLTSQKSSLINLCSVLRLQKAGWQRIFFFKRVTKTILGVESYQSKQSLQKISCCLMLVEVRLCPSCSVEFVSIKRATEPLFSSADGDTCSNCSRSGLDLSEWTQKGTRVNRSCRALLCDLFKQKSKMSTLVGWGHIKVI